MPNWVSNVIEDFTPELKEKYFTDGKFDFNKLIKRPEELDTTISGGSINEYMAYYLLKTYPRQEAFQKMKEYVCTPYGGWFRDARKNASVKALLEAFEASEYMDNPEMLSTDHEKDIPLGNGRYKRGDYGHTAEEVGKYYVELHEKYGVHDWYFWSVKNWGTKWNACDTYYNEEDHVLSFNTAWSSPDPIFEALSKENPDIAFHITVELDDGTWVRSEWKNGVDTELEYGDDCEEEEEYGL